MTSLMHSDTNCVPKSSKIRKSVTSQYGSATDHRVIEHHGAAEALEAEIELSPADMSDMFEVDITRRETSRDTKRLRQKKIWTWDTRKTHKWYIYIYLLFTYFLQNLMPSFLCFRHDQCQVNRRQKAARALRTPRAPLAPQALWKPHWSPRCCNGQKRLERTPRYIEKVETPGWNGWRWLKKCWRHDERTHS